MSISQATQCFRGCIAPIAWLATKVDKSQVLLTPCNCSQISQKCVFSWSCPANTLDIEAGASSFSLPALLDLRFVISPLFSAGTEH